MPLPSQQVQGYVAFDITFEFDAQTMRYWQPERIAAFFSGIAKVLKARGEPEAPTASKQSDTPAAGIPKE